MLKRALSWGQLHEFAAKYAPPDAANGFAHAQSRLRLFGQPESAVRVTLYRDNHAWCPYCQKVWLWLEEKQVPYRVEKVTMFCYGEKENWYKKIVPSGMLPALALDGKMITESDGTTAKTLARAPSCHPLATRPSSLHLTTIVLCSSLVVILANLEATFGPLSEPMRVITRERQLERHLFRAWCGWLCYPQDFASTAESDFVEALQLVEYELGQVAGPWCVFGACPDQPSPAADPPFLRGAHIQGHPAGFATRSERRTSSSCHISSACARHFLILRHSVGIAELLAACTT